MNAHKQSSYNARRLLIDMWSFIRPYRGRFWLATVLRFTSDLVWLYPAWALGEITNFFVSFERGQSLERFWWLMAGFAGAGLYRFVVIEFAKFSGYQVAERIGLDARVQALQHLFSLDLRWHETMRSGAKLKRISRGGEGLNRILRFFYTNILEASLNIVAVSIILHTLGLGFSLAFFFYVFTYYALSYVQTRRAERQSIYVSEQEEALESTAYESVNNILTVKTMGFAGPVIAYVKCGADALMREIRTRINYFRVREGSLNTYTIFARLAGFAFIGWGIAHGRHEVGLLIMFSGYFDLVWRATSELAQVTNEIAIHKVEVARMMELMALEPTIEGKGTKTFPVTWERLGAEHVSFAYRKRKVLDDVTLSIRKGEKVGLVGHSGAGKSTLFKILLKLYEDYEGTVSFDGMPLRDIDRASYVQRVAVVLQETELFDLSLKDNITIVAGEHTPDPSQEGNAKVVSIGGVSPDGAVGGRGGFVTREEERLLRALSVAHLDELVKSLPQSADTLIGEKGVKLSGGEKQRLGIARAVYKNPEILFLDEATSHLDADSERKIQDSLHEFFKGSLTAIVIAHRLSTIRQMDRIIVLEKGRIAEEGTFDALLEKRGVFYTLWEAEFPKLTSTLIPPFITYSTGQGDKCSCYLHDALTS